MSNQRVALITGAGRGIGRAIAMRLARDGLAIAVNDIDASTAESVAMEINGARGRAVAITADISNYEMVSKMIAETVERLASLDVMVNNAGVIQIKPIAELVPADIERVFKINVYGTLYGVQAAAAQMIVQGGGGKIINAASVAGHDGFALSSVYAASKFAVRGLTQVAAREFAPHGITVNAYCPGVVDTDMWVSLDRDLGKYTGRAAGESREAFRQLIALGRIQTAEDVAGLVSFLASRDSDYMTGQSPIMDGGLVLR
jgi:meso-butanediol dehydrogenase / (S,S)-butanediol dehydrogenase / diacetyl reductase